ncbi:MAG: ribonuclease P protein component [Patescibacteria group bacterium]|jgi:ribonuclease P protein component
MLSKEFRIRKDKEIKTILGKGKGFYSKVFGIKFLPNQAAVSRFCFVVSNKVSKQATKRNTLKRKVNEIIRLNLKKIKPGIDLVIMARTGADILSKDYKELERELFWALNKSGLTK